MQTRPQIVRGIAEDAQWRPQDLETDSFRLRLYLPAIRQPYRKIFVYIEGDGLPWIDRYSPSSDPTPRDPIALRMAVAQGAEGTAYIARPCQYTVKLDSARCQASVWTNARYSEPVLAAISQAVDHIKSLYGAHEVALIGYSGGGVVAALLAARREDVSLLITVAANLDTQFWTDYHKVTPLVGSLNPVEFKDRLKHQRQVHFVGADDEVVPPSVARSYALKIDKSLLRTIRHVDDADHTCCWEELWPTLAHDVIPQR